MKITYTADAAEMTDLANLLKRQYRGQMFVRFTEDGVEVDVETSNRIEVDEESGSWELPSYARAA